MWRHLDRYQRRQKVYNYTDSVALSTWNQDIARDNYDKRNGFSVRCAEDVDLTGNEEIRPNEDMFLSNSYPNPIVSTAIIYFKLPNGIYKGDLICHDILGTEVLRINVDISINVISISTSDLSAGTYFYYLQTSQGVSGAKKMIVINNGSLTKCITA